MEQNAQTALCKSVFRQGEDAPSPECFTKMWVEMINRMERNKNHAPHISQ